MTPASSRDVLAEFDAAAGEAEGAEIGADEVGSEAIDDREADLLPPRGEALAAGPQAAHEAGEIGVGLAHTQFAGDTCGTIGLKLLKIGARVRVGGSTNPVRQQMNKRADPKQPPAAATVRLACAKARP